MAQLTSDPMLGRLVDGRYEITSRIARGGMATVYVALDRRLEREVALKVMHPHLADGVDGAAFVSRFRREARAAARLAHPGVVAVYDQGFDGETSYLTMEYVPGSNLRRELRAEGSLTLGRTLDVLEQVLGALAAAHRKGLVHRDIKPENALITTDGVHVKVADFGLARAVTEVTSTTTGTILGTVAYLAPEVITSGACDARADVYAVGVLAYEMLTGALPHAGATPIQVAYKHVHDDIAPITDAVPWAPEPVARLIARFVARDPQHRPEDGGAAVAELRAVRRAIEADRPEMLTRRADTPPSVASSATAPGGADGADPASDLDTQDGALEAIPFPEGTVASAQVQGLLGAEPDLLTEQLAQLPTTVVPGAPQGAVARRRWPRVLAWTATVAALLGGAAYGTWWWFDDGPGAWTTVPAGLEQVDLDAAAEALAAHGLGVATTEAHDDEVPEGSVVSVRPGEGEAVRKDGTVELVVSLGVRMVTVPDDLVGAQQDAAQAALTDAGLTVGPIDQEWSDTVPAGEVMAVSHDAQTSVPHSTVVALTVSGGPAPATVTQQVGRDQADAQAALEDLGFRVELTDEEPSLTVPAGRVIRQSPESGTRAHRLDVITLTISSGPPILDVPDVVGMSTSEATDALTEAGFEVDPVKYLGGLLDTVRFQEPTGTAPQGSTVKITVW